MRGSGVVLVILGLSIAGALPATAEVIKQLNLDAADSVALKIETDGAVKQEGEAAVRIETLWPTNVCLGQFAIPPTEKKKLVYRAKVKSSLREGNAFLEMWCRIDGREYFSRGMNAPITGTTDWVTLETPFFLQAGQKADRVTLNVTINGRGTIWVDDAKLVAEPLKP